MSQFFGSIAIHHYHSSILVGFLGFVLCPYRPDVSWSLLIRQNWHVYV